MTSLDSISAEQRSGRRPTDAHRHTFYPSVRTGIVSEAKKVPLRDRSARYPRADLCWRLRQHRPNAERCRRSRVSISNSRLGMRFCRPKTTLLSDKCVRIRSTSIRWPILPIFKHLNRSVPPAFLKDRGARLRYFWSDSHPSRAIASTSQLYCFKITRERALG